MSWATMGYTTDSVLKPKEQVKTNISPMVQSLSNYSEWRIVTTAQNMRGHNFQIVQPMDWDTPSFALTLEEVMVYFDAE